MRNVIAVPSDTPGGLNAGLGAHFGHCDLYTIVSVEDGAVTEIKVIPNLPHEHGGCMAPVQHLAQSGVTQLIAGGMGLRPLMGFNQKGIDVYHGNGAQTVGEAIQSMLEGRLQQFRQDNTCSGCNEH